MKRIHWMLIAFFLFGAGCSGTQAFSPTVEQPTGTQVATLALSPTDTPVPSQELVPSSPTPTATLIPTATPTPTVDLSCMWQGGEVAIYELETERLPDPLIYRVYTPPCYDEIPENRFPVLFLLHGQTYTDDQWDRLGADEVADALIASGEIPPLIIVMPRDRRWIQPPQNKFGEALVYDLLPLIDQQYRTIPQREYRAIGGLSWGANWAVHIGLTEWRYFGKIGAHSYPVFTTDGPQIPRWLESIPEKMLPQIYLDSGVNDRWLSSTLWFENLLTEMGVPHEWYLFQGAHDETYWTEHVEAYLRWYTSGW